jgi:hypothetical protein
LKVVHHILPSSAETIGAFNKDFDNVNLHRPTWIHASVSATSVYRRKMKSKAEFESGASYSSLRR